MHCGSAQGGAKVSKATFKSNLAAAQAHFIEKITAGMLAAQEEYARDMKVTLSQEPHGRYYRNAGTPFWYEVEGPGPGVHRASAPGEPPAEFSGFLRDSIDSGVVSVTSTRYEGAVSTKAPYAALLEFGGVNSERHNVEPRPAWLPTLLFNRKKYLEAIQRRVGR